MHTYLMTPAFHKVSFFHKIDCMRCYRGEGWLPWFLAWPIPSEKEFLLIMQTTHHPVPYSSIHLTPSSTLNVEPLLSCYQWTPKIREEMSKIFLSSPSQLHSRHDTKERVQTTCFETSFDALLHYALVHPRTKRASSLIFRDNYANP